MRLRKREFLKKENKELFLGREEFIEEFKRLYETLNQREVTLLNYYGVGGIGKSTLLRHIQKSFEKSEIPVFYFDLAKYSSVIHFYEAIYIWLQKNNIDALYFQMAFLVYWKRVYPNIDFKESLPLSIQEGGLFGDVISAVFDNSLEAIKDYLPVVGGSLKFLHKGYKYLKEKLHLDEEIVDAISELEDSELSIKDVENHLAYFLAQDFERLSEVNSTKAIFLFDTYEKLYEFQSDDRKKDLEAWVENFAYNIKNHALLLIAGREKIRWKQFDPAWDELIFYYQLGALKEDEVKELIQKQGIKDREVIEAITKTSKGYPFYVKLAVDAYKSSPKNFDYNTIGLEEIFQRFVGNLSKESRTILEYLSIPKSFDRELYQYILQKSNIAYSEIIFNEITSYSFFSQNDHSYTMHDIMRESFHKQFSPEYKKSLHRLIFEFFKEKPLTEESALLSSYHLLQFANKKEILEWIENIKSHLIYLSKYQTLENIYTEILSKTNDGELKIIFSIELALLYLYLDQFEPYKKIVEELEFYNVPIEFIDDISYLKAMKEYITFGHKIFNKKDKYMVKKLKIVFKSIHNVIAKSDTHELKNRAYIELAKIHRRDKKYYEAKSTLFTLLNITKDSFFKAKAYDNLGYLYRDLKEYHQAIEYFSKALQLKKKILDKAHIEIAKSYRGLAQVLVKLARKDEAFEVLSKAIAIFEQNYDKYSRALYKEYKTLLTINDDNKNIDRYSLDKELFLLAKLEKNLKHSSNNTELLLELEKLPQTSIQKYLAIASILLKYNKELADKYQKLALQNAHSNSQKWKTNFSLYLMLRKKYPIEAEIYIQNLVTIAQKISFDKEIESLQRLAYFYANYKKQKEQAIETYEKILSLLAHSKNKKRKTAQIYHYISLLQPGKAKIAYIQKEIAIYKELELYYEQAEAMLYLYKVTKQFTQDYKELASILENIAKIYEESNNLGKMDSTLGRLIELYINNKEFQKALELQYKQIEIRKKQNNIYKLSKGYKFLADFLFEYYHDTQKAQEFYEKSYKLILENDSTNFELLERSSYHLMLFYKKTKNLQKEQEILEIRKDLANKSNIIKFTIYANRDLEYYYNKIGEQQKALKILESTYNLVSKKLYPKERLTLLERFISYAKNKKYNIPQIKQFQYLLEAYELALYIEDFEKADSFFNRFLKMLKNTTVSKKTIDRYYKELFKNLLKEAKYKALAKAISRYKEYDKEGRGKFLKYLVSLLNNPNALSAALRIYQHLRNLEADTEAAYFYEKYFDLKLIELKSQYDIQEELYKKALEVFEKLNQLQIKNNFLERYERFKKRKANLWIVNGVTLSKVLFDVIKQRATIDPNASKEEIITQLKAFLMSCLEDRAIQEKIQNHKLNISVIIQGIEALLEGFEPIKFGFEKNYQFLSWLCGNTPLAVASSKTKTNYIIVSRENYDQENYELIKDIVDYENYVHTSTNYAILLSKLFFDEKGGIFFSKNKELDRCIYNSLSKMQLININYSQIISSLYQECQIKEESDKQRAKNIVKNLYNANLFLIENPYESFNNFYLTLSIAPEDIKKELQNYSYKKLKEFFKEAREELIIRLWDEI